MENQLINVIKDLQTKSPSSIEYQEFENQIHDENFQQILIGIVLNKVFSLDERKLTIYVLKTFHSLISYQILEPLFSLILDETIQSEIANLFIYSFDEEYTINTVISFLNQKILNETPDLPLINGAVYCYSEYVEKYKKRNNDIIQILLKILVERENLREEIKDKSVEIIIKQMLLTPPEEETIRNEDLSIVFQLFISLNLECTSIKVIDYIITFINERVYYIDGENKSYECLYHKFIEVLDRIISMCPLSIRQDNITTPLYNLIRIMKELDFPIPFEKLFPILIIGPEQMNSIENDIDYFFGSIMKGSDNRNEDEEEEEVNEEQQFSNIVKYQQNNGQINSNTKRFFCDENEEESSDKQDYSSSSLSQQESFSSNSSVEEESSDKQDYEYSIEMQDDYSIDDSDQIEEFNYNSYWEKNCWKCLNMSQTLNDTQSIIRLYIIMRDDDYIKNAIMTCIENINQSPLINFAIILLLRDISSIISFNFDPSQFETFGNRVIQFLLLDYCNAKILQKSYNDGNDEDDIFFNFMKNFNLRGFAESMISQDEPINILCMFRLITDGPREFIDPDLYVAVLFKTLTVVFPNLNYTEDKIELLEKVFDYLNPGQSLTEKKINYVLSFDKNVREQKSKSIFCLKKEFVFAFKQAEESFFGQALLPAIRNSLGIPAVCQRIAKIIKYFEAGNIPKYISRHTNTDENNNNESIVDISNYNIFFSVIVQLFQEIIQHNMNESQINAESFFTLFAQTFINICYPENESIVNIINSVFEIFINLNIEDLLQFRMKTMNSVLRIFIKYGRLEKLDSIVFGLCRLNKSYIDALVYEISVILINQKQVFSEEIIQQFSIYLRSILRKCPRFFVKSIACIFARVALFDRNRLQWILADENIEELFLILINNISDNSFQYYTELEQRMVIALFGLFSQNEQMETVTKNLFVAMVKNLHGIFSDQNNEICAFPITSSFGLIKESTFYDDQDFLTHPFISSSLSKLIHEVHADDMLSNFLMTYPFL